MKLTPRAKDVFGAALLVFAVFIIFGFLWGQAEASAFDGEGPIVTTGFAYEVGDTFGNRPTGVVKIEFPLFQNGYLAYTHLSSVPDENDLNSYDAFSIEVKWPFGNTLKRDCK